MAAVLVPHIAGLFAPDILLPALLDEIPLGLAVLDAERRIVLLNRALRGLTGFVQQEVRGIPCAHVLRSNICLEKCPFTSIRDNSGTVCLEGNLINRDRQKIPVRVTFGAIRDPQGKIGGFLEAVEDMRFLREQDLRMSRDYGFSHLIGHSPQMGRLLQILPIIAQSDSSVLITGETGTGKDLVAEAIHQACPRAKNPFIKVNCGALPETLLESELFGHQKGAFTGAVENKPGRFRLAHNGSLYLTEIGDLPLALQVKLLTFLDDKIVYPLGSTKGFQVNVRVIAATHRNLEQMVQEERFRQDLLFRLNVVRLHLPPLRERGEDDIRLLLEHFLHAYAAQFHKPVRGFSARALRILLDYSYPGNVRELRNIVEYALNVCQEDPIHPKHLPAYLTDPRARDWGAGGTLPETPAAVSVLPELRETDVNWAALERNMILEAMLQAKGRRSKAADLLGWGRSTLWRKMKQYGLDS
jgi:two-component system, NtrC family, response regulator AtoC